MTMALLAAGGSKTMWYLTRASGAVTLVLLTLSLCLGIVGTRRWRSARLPRFSVAALHRNLTLLTIVFLTLHVLTSVADTYAPIGLKDVVVPFTSAYRPLWLGLGALACDLLLALVLTSLVRVRIGLRAWRLVHWLAYACWPLALLHALGTGSDPRAGWLQALAAGSVAIVLAAVALRLVRSSAEPRLRLAGGGAIIVATLAAGVWYAYGPDAPGWAGRAGTPASLLHQTTILTGATEAQAAIPASFDARLSGHVSEQRDGAGLVEIHLAGGLAGGLRGVLRLDLEGVPVDDGGVSMTASGVAFAAAGSPVYEGQIVALDGTRLTARVADSAGQALLLSLVLHLSAGTNAFSGSVRGSTA